MRYLGTRTVLRAGTQWDDSSWSSKPMMASRSGKAIPSRWASKSAPKAMTSLEQKIASVSGAYAMSAGSPTAPPL
jgi:hypothetical protein